MIKQTFYNLPQEKREKIVDVTKKEFLKGKKQKITINNVIKEAGISRGSFYQYFDDKLDLVEIVVDDMLNKITHYMEKELINNNGDMFHLFINIFDLATKSSNNDIQNIKNLDLDTNQNRQLITEYMQYRQQKTHPFTKILNYINTTNFQDDSQENLECVFIMLTNTLKDSIMMISKGLKTIPEERMILMKKINIIKNGVLCSK